MVLFGQRISKRYKSDQTFDISFWYKMEFDDGLIVLQYFKTLSQQSLCVAHLIAGRSCIFLLEPSALKPPSPRCVLMQG